MRPFSWKGKEKFEMEGEGSEMGARGEGGTGLPVGGSQTRLSLRATFNDTEVGDNG